MHTTLSAKLSNNLVLRITMFIIALVGVYFLARYAYNEYAKISFLKGFYAKIASAEKFGGQLNFDNLIIQITDSERPVSYRSSTWLDYCSSVGTYRDNQTGETINGARYCRKSYIYYYWVSDLSIATITRSVNHMTALGWRLNETTDAPAIGDVMSSIDKNESGASPLFDQDGVSATLAFLDRQGHDRFSSTDSSARTWCSSTASESCVALDKADSDKHRFYIRITIDAIKNYDE